MRPIKIMKKLKELMAVLNTADLLYIMRMDIDFLYFHNKNYTKEQEERIDRLKTIIDNLY